MIDGGASNPQAALLVEEREQRDLARMQRVCPRWLHVLMPAEHQRSDARDSDADAADLAAIRPVDTPAPAPARRNAP